MTEAMGGQPWRQWAVVVLMVLVASAAGAGAGYWLVGDWLGGQPASAGSPPAVQPGPVYSLGDLMTNLSDETRPRYIRVVIDLEADSQQTVAKLEARSGAVRDTVLRILRATSSSELAGAEGMARLAEQIRTAVNELLDGGKVRNVYFLEFVVQ